MIVIRSCNPLIWFHGYLVNESSQQGEVRCRIGGKDTSCGLYTSYCQVSSTIVMYGFCIWKQY